MEIMNTLTDYISPTYTQKSKDIFSRLPLDKYKLLLNMYSNQNDVTYSDYILFKLEDHHLDVEIVNNYSTISDENTYIVIYYDPAEKSYLFQTFDFTNMFELIISNANRYIFVPIMFSLKDSKIGHATMLIIDKQELTIKFFDSNGITRGYINSNIVDKFFKTYFDIFNITFNESYTYINQKSWIDTTINNYSLNTSELKNQDINSGHCMIFTLIVAHILSKSDYKLNDIISHLNKIKKSDLLDIVMGYTERAVENLNLIV